MVLGTIYAAENNIWKEKSNEMPLVSIFGSELGWALRDAIAFGGNYRELYAKNFGESAFETERNMINSDGSPQHLAPPGLGLWLQTLQSLLSDDHLGYQSNSS